ncbi:MAG: hypothetical protein A2784_02835 [Candidatus Chisholmbacteria bacterium RIFCSPHIGHO2_01_FULL_48_12]|uniref:Ferric oxidoreductase domain-containing protein n=1 Tax=Candidatus Chisholmbacteria bacterium RIFCSPHIGHO2_01_FULL_48_12 TaxID=1797589 RepID=A0A1G1VPT5_9BACT|nr:MAG: hypothetical protein A2784_02835 [Candidatus Chisholmbacteria bacterium RIFCSPHIGHO2_01_FULL_48_12]
MNLLSIQAIYLLGISNLVFLVLVLLSCRCFVGTKVYLTLLSKTWFKKFYQYHCWYWWGFIISVLLHTLLAFLLFGFPFKL